MLTVIGDTHAKYGEYLQLTNEHDFTFQLGDMGFNYEPIKHLNPDRHRFGRGNHDNTDIYYNYPQNVGDWGMRTIGGISFFWVGGAFSVDREARMADELRTGRKSWWENEQLNRRQMEMALAEYCDTKPAIMLTHAAPKSITDKVGNPSVLRYFGFDPSTFNTDTQQLLEIMFQEHEPDLWLHGHLHISHKTKVGNTRFIGLNELETYTLS